MSGNPSYILSQAVLNQIAGFLEPVEGFGKNNTGALYNVGRLVLVGYGLQLTDQNGLRSALDALTETVVVRVNGVNQTFSGNVFQIASGIAVAGGTAIPTISAILASFQSLLSGFDPGIDPNAHTLAQNLGAALTDWMTGMPLGTGGTPAAPPIPAFSCQLDKDEAETALGTASVKGFRL